MPEKLSHTSRRSFLKSTAIGSTLATLTPLYPALGAARELSPGLPAEGVKPFELDEITIPELQEGMKSGKFTARSLVEKYSSRIDEIDKHGPSLNSIIEMNPDALAIADELDREERAKGLRSPLHGIPVLIKDNIDTADKMMTTAGSLALLGSRPAKDSFVAQRLRAAGAVILGKTNLSEWANIRSSHSTSGWSGRGGLTKMRWIEIPAGQARAQARRCRRICAPQVSEPKPMDRSSARRLRTALQASSPPWVWSAGPGSSRFLTVRTGRARCVGRCGMPPFCWARSRELIQRTPRPPAAKAKLSRTIRNSATPTA
jgi:hypothetical protein